MYVVDSNIVFSAILNPNSKIGQIILNGSRYFSLISVDQLNVEIANHESKILQISKLSRTEYLRLYELIRSRIRFVHHQLIDDENYQKADKLTRDIDSDDLIFVGLAVQFHCKLWSGDKKLIAGLYSKGFKQTITTEELFQIYLNKVFKRQMGRD